MYVFNEREREVESVNNLRGWSIHWACVVPREGGGGTPRGRASLPGPADGCLLNGRHFMLNTGVSKVTYCCLGR